jgi:glutathione-regulated potassium-efflux system protein KefB
MATEGIAGTLEPVLVLLGAGTLAVPLFRRLGLGSVLGYFAAGLLVGPHVFGLISDAETILHIAELGVVMFLFIVGLEMRPRRLWALRGQIFGLGLAQVALCAALLTGAGVALGLPPAVAFVGGAGFVLSSTAVIMQVLQERGEAGTPAGQKAISILLLEDLSIVPLLALVAFLAPGAANGAPWGAVATALAATGALVAVGLWLLNPFFELLARARSREVLTAGALLVVLGSAFLMQAAGLSMAMGAFLAGVLLSGSSYRHQIETDIEPFKGILLGLFFLAVGMSLDLAVIAAEWRFILVLLAVFMAVKAAGVYATARAFGAPPREATERTALFAQGGEFGFVLYAAALAAGLFDARIGAVLGSVTILSMALTPLVLIAVDRMLQGGTASLDGVDRAEDLHGRALVIGFGRFGQIASQALLARGIDVSIIDNSPDRIREAGRFGFKLYYGDGTRLDILHASGAREAEVILVCVDGRAEATAIAHLVRAEFPNAKLLVRAYDRAHSIELIRAGVDFELRETVESAFAFGAAALEHLGVGPVEAQAITDDIRRRDRERLSMQVTGGLLAGKDLMHGTADASGPVPEPLTPPRARRAEAAE